jgi:ketosteroid isomerase-like protein
MWGDLALACRLAPWSTAMGPRPMNGDDMADLDDVLARLDAERAITAALYRYGDALDHGDRDEFLNCFTEDGDYRVNMLLGSVDGLAFRGHDQLGGYFDGHTHAPAAFHKHVTVNPLITLDGDTAEVQSYFMRIDSPQPGPAVVLAAGRYLDHFVRGADQQWRISSRRCQVENL